MAETASTTPPVAAAALAPGAPFTVALDVGNEPSLDPTNVKPPTAAHPWLVVGDYRSAPGAPSEVAAFLADSAESGWRLAASSGAAGPDSITYAVETMADGSEVLFGFVDGELGLQPAWWRFDGASLAGPNLIDYSAVPGEVTEAAVAPDGSFFVEIRRFLDTGDVTIEHARRTPDGTWSIIDLPGAVDNGFDADGAAARGASVVLTGRDAGGTTAYSSIDGGTSFTVADTTAFQGEFAHGLSSVAAGPDGFYAAVCNFPAFSTRAGYAYSADGLVWERRSFRTSSSQIDAPYVDEGACNRIAVDSAGGVWLASVSPDDGGGAMVYRGISDVATEFYSIEHAPPTLAFDHEPMMAISDNEVAVVGVVRGGVVAAIAPRDGSLSASGTMPTVAPDSGIPGFRENFHDFLPVDAAGTVVGVATFPTIARGGEWTTWGPRSYPQVVNADGTLADGSTAIAALSEPVNTAFLAHHSTGDVTILTTSTLSGDGGPPGDVSISRRPVGGEWSEPEPVAAGFGQQAIDDMVTIGDTTIAVGNDFGSDPNNPFHEAPLVLYIDGFGVDRIAADVGAFTTSALVLVCALPDGRALAFGSVSRETGERSLAVHIDLATRSATTVDVPIDDSGVKECASTPTGVIVVTGDNHVYTSADGLTYTEIADAGTRDIVYGLGVGDAGVALVGTTGARNQDGFLLFGPSIDQLERIDVPGLRGPGPQVAMHVIVQPTAVLVMGTQRDAPTVWPIAIG